MDQGGESPVEKTLHSLLEHVVARVLSWGLSVTLSTTNEDDCREGFTRNKHFGGRRPEPGFQARH